MPPLPCPGRVQHYFFFFGGTHRKVDSKGALGVISKYQERHEGLVRVSEH